MAATTLSLSREAERSLRDCHAKCANPANGRALLANAAKEASLYELWEFAEMAPENVGRLATRLKLLARAVDRTRYTDADEFVKLVRKGQPHGALSPEAPRVAPRDDETEAAPRARGEPPLASPNQTAQYYSWEAFRASLASIGSMAREIWPGATPPPRKRRSSAEAAAARLDPAALASASTALGVRAVEQRGWEREVANRASYLDDRMARKRKAVEDDHARRIEDARRLALAERESKARAAALAEQAAALAEQAAALAASADSPLALANRCKDPLSAPDAARVRAALSSPERAVVVDHFNYEVFGEHARRLRPGQWLVDELVNYYFAMLQQRDDERVAAGEAAAPSHFFNSFFIPKLMGTDASSYNYAGVKRWTKRFDLFSRRRVFAPVNVGNMHWCLICVDLEDKEIRYFDSMGGGGHRYLKAMHRYLEDEHRIKKGAPLPGGWTLTPSTDDTPQQHNGFDCGVFATFCAHYTALGAPLDFSQDDIPRLRQRMMLDILDKRLHE